MCIPCLNDKMIPLVEYPTHIYVNITLEMYFLQNFLIFGGKISNYPLQRPTGPPRPIHSFTIELEVFIRKNNKYTTCSII